MKRYLLILTALFITIALLASCSSSDEKTSSDKTDATTDTQTPAGSGGKFMALDLDGNFHTSKQYAGKPLILNFWGTWCPPCRKELPDLKKIYAEYNPMGLEIIGLAVNDTPEKVRNFAKQSDLDWVMLIANRESALSYQIGAGVPVTIFIDKDGNETARAIGARSYEYFKTEVEKII
ncbi:MAG: TlpA family protein disulfide reductase [candidate division Zixibacteria bacterium]|nr:TlpA family protein disulfide reductase [candidate division Zixibacteria bacterium]